jgi:hypothetical protein
MQFWRLQLILLGLAMIHLAGCGETVIKSPVASNDQVVSAVDGAGEVLNAGRDRDSQTAFVVDRVGPPIVVHCVALWLPGEAAKCSALQRNQSREYVDITAMAKWSNSDSSTLQIIGLVGGYAEVKLIKFGSAEITASLDGVTGSESVQVRDARPVRFELLAPEGVSTPIGVENPLLAELIYQDKVGKEWRLPVNDLARWSIADDQIGKFSDRDVRRGVFIGSAKGRTNVQASISLEQTYEAAMELQVTDAVLRGIEISPASATMQLFTKVKFSAYGTYSDNSKHLLNDGLTWSSQNEAIVGSNNAGWFEALQIGTTTAVASKSNVSATAAITVIQGDAKLYLDPIRLQMLIGDESSIQARTTADGSRSLTR